jgi:hypothetical protein
MEPGWFVRTACNCWYNYIPAVSGFSLSVPKLFFWFLRLCALVIPAVTPLWLKVFDKTPSMTWEEASALSGILAVLLLYGYFFDRAMPRMKQARLRNKLLGKLTSDVHGTIANLSPAVKLATVNHRPALGESIKHVLGCIRDAVRLHLGDYEGVGIDATLWVFDDAACTQMRIVARTTPGRPGGRAVKSEDLMAYHVARSRKHRIVHDFRKHHPFPKEGISLPGKTAYRAIFLAPLLDMASGSPDTCIGVVSIDSTRPYHFSVGDGEDLLLKLAPYCAWLTLLLGMKEAHRLRYNP